MDLTTKHMEVIGRGGAIDNLKVMRLNLSAIILVHLLGDHILIIIKRLQESLHAATRMLSALAVITMRKKHNHSTLSVPFVFTRCNELINHDLSSVDKISELGFPKNKRIRILERVAMLKSQHGKLRQNGIAHNNFGLILRNSIQGEVFLSRFLVSDLGMTMRKSSTLYILSGETNMVAFLQQRGKCKSFSSSPVNSCSLLNRRLTCTNDLCDLLMRGESVRI
mmetsp:Transcript_8973/g.15205  ORF Transcript_8973/g.15205 Transcript_8973/m.15205 type:complete len:223 (+) Transcript_8973:754-1422(+)